MKLTFANFDLIRCLNLRYFRTVKWFMFPQRLFDGSNSQVSAVPYAVCCKFGLFYRKLLRGWQRVLFAPSFFAAPVGDEP